MLKIRNLIILTLLVIPMGAVALAKENNWEVIAEGIQYQEYRITNPVPVNIFVARMDRDSLNLTIDSSIAQGRLSGGVETVSGMADRYDQALNYWGAPTDPTSQFWGPRNNVVVAINGFYYGDEIEPPGVPWSGQIHSGWYAKRYDEGESLSGFVWKMDRTAFIGECITHPYDKQVVFIENGENQHIQFIDGLNASRSENELILYTPQFDSNTKTEDDSQSIEVLVEMEMPTSISVPGDLDKPFGFIREIRDHQGSTPIPFNHVVLSAHGTAATELRPHVKVGNPVAIAQRVKDCTNSPTHDWTYAYAGVGGQFHFLRDGDIFDYSGDGQAIVRNPRTAIAFNDQYIFFIVADGRNPGVSEGMKVAEMAAFVKNTLGATDGIMQDGGGSSTMVIKRPDDTSFQVVNNSVCNNVNCNEKVFLPIVIKPAKDNNLSLSLTTTPDPIAVWDSETLTLQRLVANGMMMVVVKPIKQSTLPYHPDDPITTTRTIDVYLGPGTNYAILDTVNGEGSIMDSYNETSGIDLGGILAKGSYWWEVDFGNVAGWVSESDIVPLLKSRSSSNFKAR